jgi:hypothetical protein
METTQFSITSLYADSHLLDLTVQEQTDVNGGESIWYWVAYGIGQFNYAASAGPSEYDRIRRESGFGK